MLTDLREKSQSFGIYILFGILIVVFIFFFGPQADGFQPGATTVNLSEWAVEAEGAEVSQREVEISVRRQALYDPDFDADAEQLKALRAQTALQIGEQALIEQRARRMGLALSEASVSKFIVSKENPDFPLFTDRAGNFDKERYRGQLTQALGATTDAYRAAKEREAIADGYLQFLQSQVRVSDAEVRAAFDRARRTWNLEYIAFDPAEHGGDAEATAAQGAAFAKANADKVEAYYNENKKEYDRDTEIKVRRVLIRKPKDADAAAIAAKKKQAEDLRTQAMAEGADFEAIAKASSEGYYKTFGGDMGWQSKENTSEGDYAIYAKLTKGQVSEVVESAIGFWFVKAEDVKPAVKKTLDEVRDEIGRILAREDVRLTATRAIADKVLAGVKGGASLDDAMSTALPPPPAPEPTPEPTPAPEDGAEGEPAGEPGAEGDAPAETPPVVDTPEKPATSTPPPSPVKTTGPFSADRPQWERIPTMGKSEELAGKLAGLTAEEPLVDKVLEIEGKLYVVRLKERKEPDAEAFAKEKQTFADRLRSQRAALMFGNWEAVLFGPVRQREVFRRFSGGALLAMLQGSEMKLNPEAYGVPAAAEPAEGKGEQKN